MSTGRKRRGDERLIERWLPIAQLGAESRRENGAAIKATPNRLHVWWARRPLVTARAAVLASLLPAQADRDQFLHALGIHGDPVETRRRLDEANRTERHLGPDPYGYKRAFAHTPSADELRWIAAQNGTGVSAPTVLDPTAGGGSIPFEASRLGFNVAANDLNPVAALLLRLTVAAPRELGAGVLTAYRALSKRFIDKAEPRFAGLFPHEPQGTRVLGYLWARTIACPHCAGLVPLSPHWRLAPGGKGVRVLPKTGGGPNTPGRVCRFETVRAAAEQSPATVRGGAATCPYPDCGSAISGDEVKRQAQAGMMGDQLYAVVFKRRVVTRTKAGRPRASWERGYRAAAERDEVLPEILRRLAERRPDWERRGIIPTEAIPDGNKTSEPLRYGITTWSGLFNARQLYGHCTAVDVYQELVAEERERGPLAPDVRAAFGYLALALDKMLNYNSRMSIWMPAREIIANTFNRHDFAFCWSFSEMAPLIAGAGYEWAIAQTARCIKELVELAGGSAAVRVTCADGARLEHLPSGSVDAVVIDPPYGANVMYAELSDFFYVWLKRTAGLVYPELFGGKLTDKNREAVANRARFNGRRGAAALAELGYRDKLAAIFAECRRVLKPDGIMTLMFTHKATGGWDALARALMDAGFVITASWPINTESESSLHIRDKAAANSTILLACRPRAASARPGAVSKDELERRIRDAVRARVGEFERAGIRGVDVYLASFGPALQVLSAHWPVHPHAVTPAHALDVARAEVSRCTRIKGAGAPYGSPHDHGDDRSPALLVAPAGEHRPPRPG